MTTKIPVIVIGAGPAGLAAAHELAVRGVPCAVVEKSDKVGGLARTEIYKGYRFDIGGHRFYTKVAEVQKIWRNMLGEDLVRVPRLSRIYFQGCFINYPLDFFDALSKVGLFEGLFMLMSYFKARILPHADERTFEDWIVNRFGRRLYKKFFKTYTEKVWGVSCQSIRADWAAQRISGLSLKSALVNALLGKSGVKSLIKEFHYPLLGPGMMWERFRDVIESKGGRVFTRSSIVRFKRSDNRITGVTVRRGEQTQEMEGEQFISSCPLSTLVFRLDPPPPDVVLTAARKLNYRAFILVGLIVDRANLFPDNWIYIHEPGVRVGRIQNFKNWSAAMVPDPNKSSLGMEYFCNELDDLWSLSDDELRSLAAREAVRLKLVEADEVEDGVVFRQSKAYPLYDDEYLANVNVIQEYLSRFSNLQTIGRNGMHRYNNQDHSMLTGILAVENIFGGKHNLWKINTERSHYEEFAVTK